MSNIQMIQIKNCWLGISLQRFVSVHVSFWQKLWFRYFLRNNKVVWEGKHFVQEQCFVIGVKRSKCVLCQLYNKQMCANGDDLNTANSITANQYFLLLPIGLWQIRGNVTCQPCFVPQILAPVTCHYYVRIHLTCFVHRDIARHERLCHLALDRQNLKQPDSTPCSFLRFITLYHKFL